MDNNECIRILEKQKERKIKYCKDNGLPIPTFEREDDYWIPAENVVENSNQLQKPLTFEELMNLPDSVWYDNKFVITPIMVSHDTMYSIHHKEMVVFGIYRGIALNFFSQMELPVGWYGKTWRCWAKKPTDEERAAAKWEEYDE